MTIKFKDLIDEAIDFRHYLHSNPEIGWSEFNTAKKIREKLEKYNISYIECVKTATIATIGNSLKGDHIALRADIDALPIEEKTDLPYKSKVNKVMHACGHDGHTATLLATAIWLKQHENSLKGPVTFIFQPAEEGGHGAKKILDEGVLNNIDFIYGWHNWPEIKFGKAACPIGPIMAANATFHIEVIGKGGHSSQPEKCRDPIIAASTIVNSLQHIISRRISPHKKAVLSITKMNAGSSITTIPDSVKIEGIMRIETTSLRDHIGKMITKISHDIATAYETKAIIEIKPRYNATINYEKAALKMRSSIEEIFGKDWESDIPLPVMASEDFSYYLQKIPGAYALLGSDDGNNHNIICHNSKYDFNDKLIEPASKLLINLVDTNKKII
ncbi:MAG: N(2)-acetyl-L-2,4-diaminobutanoate deacetylase DoeB2 [Deferribacterota bacterium]|nr:N(2)-acetyl-L-2,4-diaminobutanoate deacetylase DoeB2 [Deferribacterota bacterium]